MKRRLITLLVIFISPALLRGAEYQCKNQNSARSKYDRECPTTVVAGNCIRAWLWGSGLCGQETRGEIFTLKPAKRCAERKSRAPCALKEKPNKEKSKKASQKEADRE